MAMITRTIVNKTTIKYKTVINGVVSDNEKTLEVNGMVGDPIKLCKKEEKMGKADSIIIVSMNEDSTLYGCTVEEFLTVAKPIVR